VAGSAGVAVAATQFPFAKARSAPARFTGYPFTLGVASGDPTSDSVVLWTRLAPSPLAGNGGMPDKAIPVQWEVAKDENFTQVVAGGEELATYGDAHSVHAEPQGLQAGFEYFYRFKAGGEISPTGRTKTASPKICGFDATQSQSRRMPISLSISGFHALIGSGTTPRMVPDEPSIRFIGYGAMLTEGLVAIMALVAATTLAPADYFLINGVPKAVAALGIQPHQLQELTRLVGEETLQGRTGGAVSLAVGMANILRQIPGMGHLMAYWYHFAIMFEAVFILTALDTRRFLRQTLARNQIDAAVLSYAEIAPDYTVQPVAVVRLTGRRGRADAEAGLDRAAAE